jgi:disulfide bond formation protein DsbB
MATSRTLDLLVGLLALGALLVAWTLQYGFGFAPCHLCLLERWPYWIVIGVTALGFLIGRPRAALGLAALALLGGAVLAGFHVGVEQGVFALPESCLSTGKAQSIEDLRRQLMAARPTCDQAAAGFLGLSLAAWNGLYSLGLAALAGWAALRRG